MPLSFSYRLQYQNNIICRGVSSSATIYACDRLYIYINISYIIPCGEILELNVFIGTMCHLLSCRLASTTDFITCTDITVFLVNRPVTFILSFCKAINVGFRQYINYEVYLTSTNKTIWKTFNLICVMVDWLIDWLIGWLIDWLIDMEIQSSIAQHRIQIISQIHRKPARVNIMPLEWLLWSISYYHLCIYRLYIHKTWLNNADNLNGKSKVRYFT